MKWFLLMMLLATGGAASAETVLQPGVYSGLWMGPQEGVRTGGEMSLIISSNRQVYLTYFVTDPITGTRVTKSITARFLNQRVFRAVSNGRTVLRASSQDKGRSVRGWYLRSGRTVQFFADYSRPLDPEVD